MRIPTWPRPSTRAFMREARRLPGYSLFDWLHGYVYARWPYLYIGIGTGEHPLAKRAKPVIVWLDRLISSRAERRPAAIVTMPDGTQRPVGFADTYHGKVMTLAAATQLVTVKQDLNLGDLEHIVPYATARDIVLQNPDHIVAMECPCRAARANPCLPMDVCLIVGEPFAGFIREHQPDQTRWINSDEAVEILTAEHTRGHVHHAFFKDAMLGRFYAICNCCSCCCGALHAQRNGVPMLAASGYVSVQDPELCIGCGVCAEYCQFEAIAMADGRAFIDAAACMGCGVCVDQCDLAALTLVLNESKGIPLEINDLMSAALSV
jgi:Pyruvate/2-oxoacid:ferredoxin oxidoreductase delta subunit